MQKTALVTMVALTGSSVAVTNPELKPSFAELVWYSDRNAVKQQMVKKGYTFSGEIKAEGAIDSAYSGSILSKPITIRHWFNDKNQLSKSSIVFKKIYTASLYAEWKTIKDSIDAKYGKGSELNNISENGKTSDSVLRSNLKSDGVLISAWMFPKYGYNIYLSVDLAFRNDNEYYVMLSYEAPNWAGELSRREKSSDF